MDVCKKFKKANVEEARISKESRNGNEGGCQQTAKSPRAKVPRRSKLACELARVVICFIDSIRFAQIAKVVRICTGQNLKLRH